MVLGSAAVIAPAQQSRPAESHALSERLDREVLALAHRLGLEAPPEPSPLATAFVAHRLDEIHGDLGRRGQVPGFPKDLARLLADELSAVASNVDESRLRATLATVDAMLRKLERRGSTETRAANRTTVAPPNDACADAAVLESSIEGSNAGATNDGSASCGESATSPEVWYRYTAPEDGLVTFRTGGSMDTVLSAHPVCPGTTANELECNDDDGANLLSAVAVDLEQGGEVLIRVAGAAGATGPFTLTAAPGGGIAGTIRKQSTGEPVADANVSAMLGFPFRSAFTREDGSYLIAPLPPASYQVQASKTGLVTASYVGDCENDCSPAEVPVGTELVPGIDIDLVAGGSIWGSVRDDSTGNSFFAIVRVFDTEGIQVGSGSNSSSGSGYKIAGLSAGDRFVVADATTYLDEVWDDTPCDSPCDPTIGEPVVVTPGSVVEDIDFGLRRLQGIAGFVGDSSGQSISSLTSVVAYRSDGLAVGSDDTFNGSYFIRFLPPGSYYLRAASSEYIEHLYGYGDCLPICSDVTDGTPVLVTIDAPTVGIDFTLRRRPAIQGSLTEAETSIPLDFADLEVLDLDGNVVKTFRAFGSPYEYAELEPGSYLVAASWHGYQRELFRDVPCDPSCDLSAATPVTVAVDLLAQGVNFELELCSLGSETIVPPGTVVGPVVYRACAYVVAGAVQVLEGGELSLVTRRRVTLGNGFRVAEGGVLRVTIDPAVGAP